MASFGLAATLIQERVERQQVDYLVTARGESGLLGVSRGPLDVEEVVKSLKNLGANIQDETHGAFPIRNVEVDLPFLKLSLSISSLDQTTTFLAISSTSGGPSSDMVKAALDTAGGTADGLLADPVVKDGFELLPTGFAMMASRGCGPFGSLEGCAGSGISATKEGDKGAVTGAIVFSGPAVAQLALSAIQGQVAELVGTVDDAGGAEVTLEGDTVRFRVGVKLSADLLGKLGLLGVQRQPRFGYLQIDLDSSYRRDLGKLV